MAVQRHRPWIIALLALVIIPGPNYLLNAQQSPRETIPYFWLNVGLGLGSHGGAGGLNLNIQPQARPLLFTLRYCFTADIDTDIGDIAFLAGYSSKRPRSLGYVSIAAGIGYVRGSFTDGAFGVPLEVQLFFTPVSFAGIGLQGFANLNKEETFYGALLCLQLGKLR